MKAAYKNDLIQFMDKCEGVEQPSMMSNGSNLSIVNRDDKRSPSMNRSKIVGKEEEKSRRKMSGVGSLCNSRSKGKNN
jgi:hypothetical protein